MIDLRRVLHPFWSACYWFPLNMAFGAWCFPRVEPYHTFLGYTGVFEWTARPHRGAIAASLPPPPPKKGQMFDKCSGEMGMVEIDWAIKERLNASEAGERLSREGGYGAFFITRSARRIRSTVLNWPELNKWRQKFRPWQHSRSREFKWFKWKWLLLVRNELLIRKTLQRGESLIVSRPLHLWYT